MTFLYPSFLAALSALAIPIIIHLVELRKSKRVLFTNVRFIQEVKNVTSHHRKIKHYLILASRILFLSFLVLGFAQPFIPAANTENFETSDVRVYFDNSMSTQNETATGDLTVLEKSLDEGKRLLATLPASSQVRIFDNSSSFNPNVHQTPANAKGLLDQLSYSSQNLGFEAVLSRISAGINNRGANSYQAFLFSDFQKNKFDPASLGSLDSTAQFYLVPVPASSNQNVFVDSVFLDDEFIRINENNKLTAHLYYTGKEKAEAVSVKFFVGDQQVSALTLDLEPEQSTAAHFTFQLDSYATMPCRIEVEDYPVSFDNAYYFTLHASQKVKILDIIGSESAPTRRLYTNERIFEYSATEVSRINYGMIAASNLVLLNGVTTVDAAVADNLRKYVAEGGNLAIIPAGSADRASYSRLFSSLGLATVSWRGQAGTRGDQRELAAPDIQNPFFSNIFAEDTRGIQMPQADQQLTWSRSASNILRFKSGGNFLSSFEAGQGTVYVFASPLASGYSEFANHAIFVPVMYKLAIRSYRSDQQIAYALSQPSIRLAVGGTDARKAVYKLVKDSVEVIPEQRLQGGSLVFSPPADMTEAGVYQLVNGDSVITQLAFNYDKRNSLLDQYTAEELRQMIGEK
ncbi:BatA and WFA domain-containing protein [soil metagenome]